MEGQQATEVECEIVPMTLDQVYQGDLEARLAYVRARIGTVMIQHELMEGDD